MSNYIDRRNVMNATIQALGPTDDLPVIVTVEQNASGWVWLYLDDRNTGQAARLTPQMVRRLIALLQDTLGEAA